MYVSRTWVYKFLGRHPEFKVTVPVIADPQRNLASCIDNLQPFFTLYTKLMQSGRYHESLIFNLDETPLCLHQSPKMKVITATNNPTPRLNIPPRMSNTTLTLCICLDGTALTPHLLWPTVKVPKDLTILRGRPINIHANGSGWQTVKSFEQMMLKDLLPAAINKRKLSGLTHSKILFILDSHISRMSLPVITYCQKHRITLLTIPAHTSHPVQPVDYEPNGLLNHSLSTPIIREYAKPELKEESNYLISLCISLLLNNLPEVYQPEETDVEESSESTQASSVDSTKVHSELHPESIALS